MAHQLKSQDVANSPHSVDVLTETPQPTNENSKQFSPSRARGTRYLCRKKMQILISALHHIQAFELGHTLKCKS